MSVNVEKIHTWIHPGAKVVITTHKGPDGDAIGSSQGLASILRKLGVHCTVIVPDPYPDFLSWMDKDQSVLIAESELDKCKEVISSADVVFSLDYNRMERIGVLAEIVNAVDAKKILIDHHIEPETHFDFSLSDTSASSTAELVCQFVEACGWESHLDVEIASYLYAGVMTDTGSFRFASTSASTHRVAAKLLETGLTPDLVHESIFDTNSLQRLQLIGYALHKKLNLLKKGRVAVIDLSLREKNAYSYQRGYTEGLVNYGLSIKGVEMAIFVSEEVNLVKLSFRSKGDISVNDLAARHFNGGGHKNAAGGRFIGSVEETLNAVNSVLDEYYG